MWRVGCRARDLRWFVYGCLGWYRCLDLVSVLKVGEEGEDVGISVRRGETDVDLLRSPGCVEGMVSLVASCGAGLPRL